MRPTSRRRNRLRSAQSSTVERWKPSAVFVVLAFGVLLGLGWGLRGRIFNQAASLQEHYMLLVSDLYAQGVPLGDVRSRLVTLGYQNPSVAVLAIADQLAASHDQLKQQEASQLHEFAAALVAASGNDQTAAAVTVQPVPTVTAASTATTAAGPAAAVVSAVQTPQVAPSSAASANAPSTASSAPANPSASVAASAAPPAAKVDSTPAAVPVGAHVGVVHTNDRSPAIIRREANIKSTAVAIAPFGARVDVLGTVRGQAVEPGETRWYHISYGGHQGYMYYTLLQVGG